MDLISFCQNCGNTITKYIVLDIVEVRDDEDNNVDPNNEDFEKVMNYTNTTLCMICWSEAKGSFCNIARNNQKTIKSKFAISSNVVMRI